MKTVWFHMGRTQGRGSKPDLSQFSLSLGEPETACDVYRTCGSRGTVGCRFQLRDETWMTGFAF
jgi:hypothetical protein